MAFSSTAPLRREIAARIPDRPFTVEFWDGTRLPSTDGEGPTFHIRSPRAAAHVLRAPGQLGLGRAYVSGEIEVDDMDAVIALLDSWDPPGLEGADKRALLVGAVRAAGITKPPPRPQAELRPSGKRHSKERDARAVRHHYDVSNEFFELFLGETMVYSCAIWARGATTLKEAQEEKLETVARKLALKEGDRVLDVGCGWGGFPLWAATKHGASVVGITLSAPQAEKARERAEAAGVADRVDLRPGDFRRPPVAERVALVMCPFRAYLHLPDDDVERLAALRAARELLVPGGLLAFDVFAPSPDDVEETQGRWIEREPGIWERATWDEEARRLTLDVRGRNAETRLGLTWLPTAEWRGLLERAGFEIEACYGWFDRRPYTGGEDSVWLARRRR